MSCAAEIRLVLKIILSCLFVAVLIVAIRKLVAKDTNTSIEYLSNYVPLPAVTFCPARSEPVNNQRPENLTLTHFWDSNQGLATQALMEANFYIFKKQRALSQM